MRKWLVLLVAGMALVGCAGSLEVSVVDSASVPVVGAAVVAQSLSMNDRAVMTDGAGNAEVPSRLGPQEVRWVSVTKAGYEREYVTVGKGSIVVTLMKMGEEKGKP